MIAIARYEQIAMTLPTYGDHGVIVQEDYFAQIDSPSIFNGSGFASAYHYHDDHYDPTVDGSEFHHYPCGLECEYCAAVQWSLKDGNELWQMVSFDRFNEKYPFIFDDESQEWYRDTPSSGFAPNQILADSWLWKDDDEDDDDDNSSDRSYPEYMYDYYGDLSFEDVDSDAYTYGYNSRQYTKTPRDNSIMRRVNWRNLRIIGAGQSAVTLTDGKYAIKVGSIAEYDIRRIESAASYGYSVPVFYFRQNRRVPARILRQLQDDLICKYGEYVEWDEYVNSDTLTADIAVLGLATPFVEHTDHGSYDAHEAEGIARRMQYEFNNNTPFEWNDAHEFNLGYYNDALVILDF